MSQISNEVAFKEVAEFIRQQDKTVHFWAGRYVAIQAGLAIAVSALYTWKSSTITWIIPTAATLLAILSIILVYTITAIIARECFWQNMYVEMVKRTEGDDPLLFRHGYKIPGVNIPNIFRRLKVVLVIAWALFIVLIWIAYLTPLTSSQFISSFKGELKMLRTFIQFTALLQAAISAFFLVKGVAGMSLKDMAELSIMHFDINPSVIKNLAGQKADTMVGSVLLFLSLLLQIINSLWPLSWNDFGISPVGVIISVIISIIIFLIGYKASYYLQQKWYGIVEKIVKTKQ